MISGSLPALVTPFANGKVDIKALKRLVDWHIDQGSRISSCGYNRREPYPDT